VNAGQPEGAVKVAVVGAGPAACFFVEALLAGAPEEGPAIAVDVIERLPTPYGLLRYGVAPDHGKIKSVEKGLARALERPGVRFVGDVELGRTVTREQLLDAYDAVVYAIGADEPRLMGVPGEDLPGSVSAAGFVSWYSGHPDAIAPLDLTQESVAVMGAGNVAIDVARTLLAGRAHFAPTDVPTAVLDVLGASAVRTVYVCVRRGPHEHKFTFKEFKELVALPGVEVSVRPQWTGPLGPEREGMHKDSVLELLETLPPAPEPGAPLAEGCTRRLVFSFWSRPARIEGDGSVERLVVLDVSPGAAPGAELTLPVQAVLSATGYLPQPPAGIPGAVDGEPLRHEAGRVLGPDGPLPGEYAVGWVKRGATGVIGSNKSDAAETARSVLADLAAGALPRDRPAECWQPPAEAVDYAGWQRIDAGERALGEASGRAREKVADWDRLRALARG